MINFDFLSKKPFLDKQENVKEFLKVFYILKSGVFPNLS